MNTKTKSEWVKPTIRKMEVTKGILALFPGEIAARFVAVTPLSDQPRKASSRGR